jgi:phosphoribosylformylglycinamidine cyclo-ligase
VPEVFKFIQGRGGIGQQEMYRTFNMGIGLVMVADPGQADRLLEGLQGDGAVVIGRISRGTGGVKLWE